MKRMIIDYSSVCVSTLLATIGNYTNIDITENMIRHMILNVIRSNINKFDVDEVIIACDSPNTWRREYFPGYKQKRRDNRKKDELKWTQIFDYMSIIAGELKEYFPYIVLNIDGCEADDIIGHLVEVFHKEGTIIIISGDKDFVQLHRFENVKQYDPVRKRWIKTDDPEKFLFEHIVKGDSSDGIPNIFMSLDHFLVGEGRQKPVTKKKLAEIRKAYDEGDLGEYEDRFADNSKLIDLTKTPQELKDRIIEEYNNQKDKPVGDINKYLIDHRLSQLWSKMQEFYPRGMFQNS